MRKRSGNPSNEAHGKAMRCYDWFAPVGTNVTGRNPDGTPQANNILKLIEDGVPGLKLYNRGDGIVNGYINTSLRADGTVYICVHLYDDAYPLGSPNNAPGIVIEAGPNLNPGQEKKIADSVGEDGKTKRKIDGGNKQKDKDNLEDAGFTPNDAPLKDT